MSGAPLSQVCGSCERSWDDEAAFCGACGSRLDASLARPKDATSAPGGAPSAGGWRWLVLGLVVAVGAALAVPILSVEGTSPVAGDVGVPDPDDLQPAEVGDDRAPVDTPRAEAPDTPRSIPPPSVSCSRRGTRVEVPCVLWIRRVHGAEGAGTGLEQTLATEDRVVTVGAGTLRGFDATTGRQQWEQPLPRPVDTASVGEDVGVLYFGGRARAFALEDGRELWTADAFTPLYGQTVADDLVHTADRTPDGPRLVVRSATDGTVQWQARTDGTDPFSVLTSSEDGVLVLTHDNRVLFLDRASGSVGWRVEEGMQPLAVRDDLVVLQEGAPPGKRADDGDVLLRALDLPDGTVRWQRPAPAGTVPLGVRGRRLLASSSTELSALDVETGRLRWTVGITEREHPAHRPDVRRGAEGDTDLVLTFGADTATLRARDPDSGVLRWEHAPEGARRTVLREGGLLLTGTAGGLDVLDVATGQRLMRVHADNPLHAVGVGPELLVDHHSGYAVRFDLPGRRVLRDDP